MALELLSLGWSSKMKTDEVVNQFLTFLDEKYAYLTRIKLFLAGVPDLFTNGQITGTEFQTFLEKYELETAKFLAEKQWYQEKIAEGLNLEAEQITFKLLVSLGFNEFEEKGRRVLRISNEITLLLFKISIYMKNFLKLQREFMQVNNFLVQKDYSAKGVEISYDPGRTFYREA
jgi:hypothetical protein